MDEKALLQQVAKGNQQAFTTIFHHYSGKVSAIAFMLTKSEIVAEELVQDIFTKIWTSREQLTDIENFQNYLFIITRNEAFTTLKKLLRYRQVVHAAGKDLLIEDWHTENLLADRQYAVILQEAIERLPQQQQNVYRLSREKGLSRTEIAGELNISLNTVKTHLTQAYKNIRAYCKANIDFLSLVLLLLN